MKKRKQILVVDDLKLNRASFSAILGEKFEILEAENGKIALEMLEKHKETIVAVILDLMMPVMDGFEFLEQYRDMEEYQDIPVIVATTSDEMENERRCLELGAWDFIPKTFHPEIIRFRVTNAVQKSKARTLELDPMTGIYNQQKFFQATREMLDEAYDEKYAFIRFDVDRFKMINFLHGPDEGGRLICKIAQAVAETVRESGGGTYGRISGDIFAMCIPCKSRRQTGELTEKIREKIKQKDMQYYMETSAGIYIIEDSEMELNKIYDNASIAAEKCKGQYMVHKIFYNQEMSDQLMREQMIVSQMDAALENEEFVVYFQPKYELEKMSPYGAEALVRWQKPDGTLISPNEFIPIFERNGFVVKLDYYVWEKVCQFIRKELDAGRDLAPISVNVSRVNLYNPKFLEDIINLVERYKIPAKHLNLEITESVFSEDATVIQDAVNNLHRAGFTILMDDFGSGYSSLNILKDVNLDVLKIDMRFFSRGASEEKAKKIVEAVIRMADSLNMPVIAEGVEEKSQVEFLCSLGCDYIQGYYFAKPMPQIQYQRLLYDSEK